MRAIANALTLAIRSDLEDVEGKYGVDGAEGQGIVEQSDERQ